MQLIDFSMTANPADKEAKILIRKMYWHRLWRPKEWGWIDTIKRTIYKIKDYDRIESDYGRLVCECTNSKMSYTTYDIETVVRVMQDSQQKFFEELYGDDIRDILKDSLANKKKLTDKEKLWEIAKYFSTSESNK